MLLNDSQHMKHNKTLIKKSTRKSALIGFQYKKYKPNK